MWRMTEMAAPTNDLGSLAKGFAQDLEIAVIGPIRSAPSPQYVVNAGTEKCADKTLMVVAMPVVMLHLMHGPGKLISEVFAPARPSVFRALSTPQKAHQKAACPHACVNKCYSFAGSCNRCSDNDGCIVVMLRIFVPVSIIGKFPHGCGHLHSLSYPQ
ncbi:hypothetical protein EVAR_27595_1 [Eumeta japonica]|uniref:Uncharacterized protein n=1 Tax=Eumeta variegata TaxID=151549 RepID=A0A4C1SHH7_EUMVA|nr:hypothetical protein EVAR_27595_1 [Eumeta japonica]